MNLYLYLVLVILSIVLIIIRIKDRRLGFLGVVVMITCWSLVARSTEPSADILSYTNIMTAEYSFVALGLFFEPILWAFHQCVYRATSSSSKVSFFFVRISSNAFEEINFFSTNF